MKRAFMLFVLSTVAVGIGATTDACTADLRDLNPCRAVTYAYCEKVQSCSGNAFPYATVDDCATAQAKSYHLRKGSYVDGTDGCPSSATECIDKIDSTSCGQSQPAEMCGDVLNKQVYLPQQGTAPPTVVLDAGGTYYYDSGYTYDSGVLYDSGYASDGARGVPVYPYDSGVK